MRIGPDGGGGEETGIDPSALQTMISTMKSSTGTALNAVDGYIAQFSRFGLETGSLTKAARDLTWAQDQLPMLSRRQSLAQAVANQDPGLTWTDVGAGTLDFPTDAAAQAAGKADGADALNALTNQSDDQFILKDLQEHQDDPAYLAAFFQALGPHGLTALGIQVTGYQQSGNTGEYQNWAGTVGDSFAVASYRMPYKSDWIDQLTPPTQPGFPAPLQPDPEAIMPFLEHGVYSGTWLNPLGKYAITRTYEEQQDPNVPIVNLDGIWTALANNPPVDAQFYQHNFKNDSNPRDSISGIMSSPSPITSSITDSAFAAMVRSATVAPAGTNIKPFTGNALNTIRYFGNPDIHTSSEIQAAFGQIVLHYWRDVVYSVTAPAPGAAAKGLSPNGLPLTAGQWAAFIDQAMRNPQTSAALLVTAHAQAKQFQTDSATTGNNYYDFQAGLTSGFFDHQAAQVYATEVSDQAQWRQQVADDTNQVIGVAVDTVFDPGAAVTTIAKPVIEDIASSIADTFINDNLPTSTPQPPVYYGQQDANAYQANIDYASKAVKTLESGQRVAFPVDTVNKYDGGSFVHNGQIDPQNAAELQAYNQWLQDPAVVSYLYGDSQNPQYDIAYQQETGGQSPPPGSTG